MKPPRPGRHRQRLFDLPLGPLPVEIINRTLQIELNVGEVVLTVSHQVHASKRHSADYARCLPHLAAVIANPAYLGDDFRNPESFELIGRAHVLGEMVLIAIKFEPDSKGRYVVVSFYPVSDKKIQSRRQRGFLRIAALV